MKIRIRDLFDPLKEQAAIDNAIRKAAYHHNAIDATRILNIMKPWAHIVMDNESGGYLVVVVDLRDVDVETFAPIICQQSPMEAVGRFKQLHPGLFQKDEPACRKIMMTFEDQHDGSTDVGVAFDPRLGDQIPNTTASLFCLIAHQAIRQFQAGEYKLEEGAAMPGSWLRFRGGVAGEYKLEEDEALADGKSG